MQRIKEQVSQLCKGWPVERVTEIVTANLAVTIAPHLRRSSKAA
jgi:hypothetical protein